MSAINEDARKSKLNDVLRHETSENVKLETWRRGNSTGFVSSNS